MRRVLAPIAVVLAAGAASAGVNQWTLTGPPLNVRTMAVDPHDPNILHTAGYGTAARSEDRGATWTLTAIPGLTQPSAIRVAASDPSTVYIAADSGLYRSTTGGRSWSRRVSPAQFPNDLQVAATNASLLVVAASNFCFLGCSGGGVFRSDNGGGSWRNIGFPDTNVARVAVDPTSPTILYAISGGKLYRTGDGGRTWRDISPPQADEVPSVAVDSIVPTTIYAATDAGVFRSLDSGRSWTLIRASAFSSMVATEAHGSRQLFTSASGLAATTNQGDGWREVGTATASGLRFNSLWQIVASGDTYYMVSDVAGAPGQILVYEFRPPRRRAARP